MSSHSVILRSALLRTVILAASLSAAGTPTWADPTHTGPPNPVIEWARLVQPAIHSANAPRSGGTSQILHTMVMLAVYDAVMAVEGDYRPYVAHIAAPPGADVRAAVATAAYLTVRPRVAQAQLGYIDATYSAYMAGVPDGPGKTDGAHVGQQAAEAVLARRANDGFTAVVPYRCSAVPPPLGEFEPDNGCPTSPGSPQPADARVGRITPFALPVAGGVRVPGPAPLRSRTYTRDFAETRDHGRADSTVRTPAQTDVAYFWSEHPYVHWNRNLANLAERRHLDVRQAARFFALVHASASDAVIAGFAAKYHFRSWRPRTAIAQADLDGNAYTEPDSTWTPLLLVNHPEYPSGHGFWSGALLQAVAAFFGTTHVDWTIETSRTAVPQLVVAERRYRNLDDLLAEIGNARIWAGLHWRHAVDDGAALGARVAKHVAATHFRQTRP